MKNMLLACAVACALSGCAEADKAVDWINQPRVRQAAVTIRTVATAVVCDVSSASQLALQVEQIAAQKGAVPVTNQVYTISTTVCGKLSGQAVGQVANVPAVATVQ